MKAIHLQDIPYYTVPGTDRNVLCDIWTPQPDAQRSGLALIYLHGSAWTLLDKDVGTRAFFNYLTAQGHVVMDVAYRLFPETDMMGMLHDAKHAIAWLKTNATSYKINPARVVIGGGSAGGHLAMLASYTAGDSRFTPPGLQQVDLSTRGVISLYGPSDLTALYYHTAQHLPAPAKPQKPFPEWLRKKMGKNFHRLGFDKKEAPGMLVPMLGGTPEEKPECYALYSPVFHVNGKTPPTLIIQGAHDIITPVLAFRNLETKLKTAGVPAVMHLLPQTDHAFDLIAPSINPASHNAYYDIERFLGSMV